MPTDTTTEYGVIIVRFQVPALHEAHQEIIKEVANMHKKVVIVLGVAAVPGTRRNPLDYMSREAMVKSHIPSAIVLPIKDCRDSKVWSNRLDSLLFNVGMDPSNATLYGGRDSFKPHYDGHFPAKVLDPPSICSGTELRGITSREIQDNPMWRAGAIHAIYHRYPTSYQTVDIAIRNEKGKVLLGRKPDEDRFRFIGGFVDPIKDSSLEEAAKREATEETGENAELDEFTYIGSTRIIDWRYADTEHRIMTAFFVCKHIFGSIDPSDDIAECKWFGVKDIKSSDIVSEHEPLLAMWEKHIKERSKNARSKG